MPTYTQNGMSTSNINIDYTYPSGIAIYPSNEIKECPHLFHYELGVNWLTRKLYSLTPSNRFLRWLWWWLIHPIGEWDEELMVKRRWR